MKTKIKYNNKLYLLFLTAVLPNTAFAASSFADILTNIQTVIPFFVNLILIISFVSGVYMIFKALLMLKTFGMPMTQMARPGELGGPLVYIIVGAILIYLPTSMQIASMTFYGFGDTYINGSARAARIIYGYGSAGSTDEMWQNLKDVVLNYVNFIGFISFVRGWFIIAHAGQSGAQPGGMKKGLMHVIAGIIAINIQAFLSIVQTTIGL